MKSLYLKSATLLIIFLTLTLRIVQAQATPVMHLECDDTSYRACYIAWHPQNDWLAIRGDFEGVRLWDIALMEQLGEFIYEGGNVIIWTPDGSALTTREGGKILLRDTLDGHIIQQVDYHEWFDELDQQGLLSSNNIHFIETMTWNPDGTRLLFISGDYVAIWNVESNTFDMVNTPEDRYSVEDVPRSLDWSPNGSMIALATTSQLAIIDADTYDVKLRINYPSHLFSLEYVGYERLKWSPDGRWIAVAVHFSHYEQPARVLLFNPDTSEFEHTFDTEARFVRSLSWSPDGRWLASANGYEQRIPEEQFVYDDNSVRIWDIQENELAQLITFDSPVYMVDWSADGNYLATSTFSGDIDIWAIELD